MELLWHCVRSFFIFIFVLFYLEAMFGKIPVRATSATVMVIFSKVLLRKLLYHSYVKVSSQELRDTLTTVF